MVDLELVKLHLRIDFDDDDDYLETLIDVSTEHVTALTGIVNDGAAPSGYDMACLFLIAHFYANRSATTDVNKVKTPYGFDTLILRLRPKASML